MNLVLLSEVAEARAQSNLKADYCRETGFEEVSGDLREADFWPEALKVRLRYNFRFARHSTAIGLKPSAETI